MPDQFANMTPNVDWPVAYALEPHDYLSDQVCGHVCCYRYRTLLGNLMCGLTKAQHKSLKESVNA